MIVEGLAGAAGLAAGALVALKWRRASIYNEFEARLQVLEQQPVFDLGTLEGRALPGFDTHLAVIENFLEPQSLAVVREQARHLMRPERSYVPTHKKGGTVAYETLFQAAPALVELYHARQMRQLISRLTGVEVQPTPINDQSSLSVLFYDKPGDHISWHYDHNFYRGRHFTVLLPVINEGHDAAGLSHARLKAMIAGRETDIATPPNSLVVFEGARVNHKVTPIEAGEFRLVVSMTYCSDPRANIAQEALRRVKDIAFFGPRALWT